MSDIDRDLVAEEREFLESLVDEVNLGRGFVPLIGSGLSDPSGIPIGSDLQNALLPYIYHVVANRWRPREDAWPSLPPATRPELLLKELESTIREKAGRFGDAESYKSLKLSYFEALGCLGDWRRSLEFLSTADYQHDRLVIREQDQSVIDAAFRHLVRDREPTYAHYMLAHLSVALRIRTILTTNFDTLTEDAFARLGTSLTRFEVPDKVTLPSDLLVLQQPSIVKLHGGIVGVKANMSLDEDPTKREAKKFCGYLEDRCELAKMESAQRKNLLVLGVGGGEKRLMDLVYEAVKAADETYKVFWLYFDDPKNHEPEPLKRLIKYCKKKKHPKFLSSVQRSLGLFLSSLYQRIYESLPPIGIDSYCSIRVPPMSYVRSYYRGDSGDAITKERILAALKREYNSIEKSFSEIEEDKGASLLYLHGGSGTSSIAAYHFNDESVRNNCVWIETDICNDLNDFKVQLLEALGERIGQSKLIFPLSRMDDDIFLRRLRRLMEHSHKRVSVYVYARVIFGSNSSMQDDGDEDGEAHSDRSRFIADIVDLSQRIVDESKSLRWVPELGNDRHCPLHRIIIVGYEALDEDTIKIPSLECDTESLSSSHSTEVESNVAQWLNEHSHMENGEIAPKRRFTLALSLVRRTRYRSILTSWAFFKGGKNTDSDKGETERSKTVGQWIEELDKRGLFQIQADGFVWMNDDDRRMLRKLASEGIDETLLRSTKAESYQGIADWYVKLFRSTNDPRAILESLFHRMRCIENCDSKSHLWSSAICELEATVRLGATRLCDHSSQTLCVKMIEDISNSLKKFKNKVVVRLRRYCAELMGDILRETADFPRAIEWYREAFGKDSQEFQYQKAVAYTALRSDKKALESFNILLIEDCIGIKRWKRIDDFSKALLKSSPNKIREMANERAIEEFRKKRKQNLKLVIKVLRRYMFFKLLQIQLYNKENRNEEKYINNIVKEIEGTYTFVTTLMRFCNDSDFLQSENVYCRTHLSIAISHVGRFTEAERRLDEALGYMAQANGGRSRAQEAVIFIRRAEIRLHQAEKSAKKNSRKETSLYFESESLLDRAEELMTGKRQNVWWWNVLFELRLMLLAKRNIDRIEEPADRAALLWKGVEYLERGGRLVNLDAFRLARYIQHFSELFKEINRLYAAKKDKRLKKTIGLARKTRTEWVTKLDRILKEREGLSGCEMNKRIRSQIQVVLDKNLLGLQKRSSSGSRGDRVETRGRKDTRNLAAKRDTASEKGASM